MAKKLFILLFIYLSFSCSQKQSQEAKKEYCANQIELVSAVDSLPLIPIQVSTSYDSVLAIIESSEKENNIKECSHVVYSGMPFTLGNDTKIKLRVHVLRQCAEPYAGLCRSVDILLNAKGQRLVEDELNNDDQFITEKLRETHLHYVGNPNLPERRYLTIAILQWDLSVPSDSLYKTIKATINGYFEIAEEYSHEVYKKRICDLTQQETALLKKNFPLYLELDLNHSSIIPPTLPQLESSEAEMINIDSTEAEIEN